MDASFNSQKQMFENESLANVTAYNNMIKKFAADNGIDLYKIGIDRATVDSIYSNNMNYNTANSSNGYYEEEYVAGDIIDDDEDDDYDEYDDEEFDVILKSVGPNIIQVIKIVREITGYSLAEAKELVDNAPHAVSERLSKEEADALVAMFRSVGAYAEIERY